MQTSFVRVSPYKVIRDPSNLREGIHRTTVDAIKSSIRNHLPIPAPKVRLVNGVYYCFDGMHRITAYQEMNIPVIDVEVFPYEEDHAKQASFVGNLGRAWSDYELTTHLLEQYRKGVSIKDLAVQAGYCEATCSNMIKRAYWLHPDLLRLVGNTINKGSADVLTHYDQAHQQHIHREIIKYQHKLDGAMIRSWGTHLNYPYHDRDIRHIPLSQPSQPIPPVQPTKVNVTFVPPVKPQLKINIVDPSVDFVKNLHAQIISFCQANDKTKEEIINKLVKS